MYTIPVYGLRALCDLAKGSKVQMQAIRVEPEKNGDATFVGGTGERFLWTTLPSATAPDAEPLTIPLHAAAATATGGSRTDYVLVTPDSLVRGGLTRKYTPPKLEYPSWRRLLDAAEVDGPLPDTDPKLLGDLCKAGKALGARRMRLRLRADGFVNVLMTTPLGDVFGVFLGLREEKA